MRIAPKIGAQIKISFHMAGCCTSLLVFSPVTVCVMRNTYVICEHLELGIEIDGQVDEAGERCGGVP